MADTIKSMIPEERPYEKCRRFGAEGLTDIELLSVLLRCGTAKENSLELAKHILYPGCTPEGLIRIHNYTRAELLKIHGVGEVKATQILCLSELSKRLASKTAKKMLNFNNPSSVADFYMENMRHLNQEHLRLLMLNTKSDFLGDTLLSKGTVNMSVISPRELFIEALKRDAVSIILLHNHPSGDPTPSKADIEITRQVAKAGELIGITLLDHIIIGDHRYVSLAEEQLF